MLILEEPYKRKIANYIVGNKKNTDYRSSPLLIMDTTNQIPLVIGIFDEENEFIPKEVLEAENISCIHLGEFLIDREIKIELFPPKFQLRWYSGYLKYQERLEFISTHYSYNSIPSIVRIKYLFFKVINSLRLNKEETIVVNKLVADLNLFYDFREVFYSIVRKLIKLKYIKVISTKRGLKITLLKNFNPLDEIIYMKGKKYLNEKTKPIKTNL